MTPLFYGFYIERNWEEFNKTFETVRKNVHFKMKTIDELSYQLLMKLNKEPLAHTPPQKTFTFCYTGQLADHVCFFQNHDHSEHWAAQLRRYGVNISYSFFWIIEI